jgi:hypothetical protein
MIHLVTSSLFTSSAGETENLNGLDQWLKWNNPGTIPIDELHAKADEAYAAREKEVFPDFSWGVAGPLTYYDLSDLQAAVAPRKLLISDPGNHLFEPATLQQAEKEMTFPQSVYTLWKMSGNFKITDRKPVSSMAGWF